jgi:hypothetical protein
VGAGRGLRRKPVAWGVDGNGVEVRVGAAVRLNSGPAVARAGQGPGAEWRGVWDGKRSRRGSRLGAAAWPEGAVRPGRRGSGRRLSLARQWSGRGARWLRPRAACVDLGGNRRRVEASGPSDTYSPILFLRLERTGTYGHRGAGGVSAQQPGREAIRSWQALVGARVSRRPNQGPRLRRVRIALRREPGWCAGPVVPVQPAGDPAYRPGRKDPAKGAHRR